jgi:hypothetical protein
MEALYRRPLRSTRTGPIFNAFSYPTKIDAEAVALFVACHTRPGDRVLDVFGGSGSTAIATRLCERPTGRMRDLARDFGVTPRWGPRDVVVYELSPLGSLLGQVMADPPDPSEFAEAARRLVREAQDELGWMYAAQGPDEGEGEIRHVIWTDVLETPCCGARITFWDAVVRFSPVRLDKSFACPTCERPLHVDACTRAEVESIDPATGEMARQRERLPARVYGRSGPRNWSRVPSAADHVKLAAISQLPFPAGAPTKEIAWGDLYRSGYHTGISRFHHLYTRRNLAAVAALWRRAERAQGRVGDALRLLVLSYNASHSTLLTRVVVKRGERDFVVTGAQSGVLYVSGLPVEKNVFAGITRKIKTFIDAFGMTYGLQGRVTVMNKSSTALDLEDHSVDYLFTDPPFGDFIPYAELNQVNEAWLGVMTDRLDEAIVSGSQGKSVGDYGRLLAGVFSEVGRVLRPTATATLVFHASRPEIWEAVGASLAAGNLRIVRTSILDKVQVSFKQVVHEGGTRGDALFLLQPTDENRNGDSWPVPTPIGGAIDALEAAAGGNVDELDPRRLYSRYVAQALSDGTPVGVTARTFYSVVAERRRDQWDRELGS